MFWADTVLLYNRGNTPASVRVLGISNGSPAQTLPDVVTVPPNRIVSLGEVLNGAWEPPANPDYRLWTLHLDVPENIVVESRDEFYGANDCILPLQPLSLGRVSMPVFKSLVPAGIPQVHLGTDLGQKESRTNVVIYNAGPNVATAHIELRRACDDVVTDQRTVTIPANTTIQVGGLVRGTDACTTPSTFAWMRYTVVSVDEPSLSLVSNVTEAQQSPYPYSNLAPEVDLGIAHNTQF